MAPKNFSGGGDLSWLERVDERTSRPETDPEIRQVGTHTGFYSGLNINNAQPGKVYQWCNNDPTAVMMARQRGWEIVGSDEPEQAAFRHASYGDVDHDAPTQLSTSNVYQDVILMRTSEEKMRAIQEANAEAAANQLRKASAGYVEKATAAEMVAGHGRTTRFARGDHGTQLKADRETVGQAGDGQGIVRE